MEVKDQLAIVTINRPKSLNALNSATLQEIYDCFTDISTRKDIRVVILTGSGKKSFVAGADISEMVNASPAEGRAMSMLAFKAFKAIEDIPQVVIGAINGYALGGGCEISMSCDIRIVSDNAKFGQPEVNLGILPGFGGTQRLSRLVGRGRAKEMIFTADMIDAEEAYRIGLANKVVPQDQLMDTCIKMANKILSKSSYAITLAKQAINVGLDVDLASGIQFEAQDFGLAFSTADKKEGMTAFLEKRPAKLTDF